MAYQLEVPYYNAFWLKHVTTPLIEDAGAPNNAHYVPLYPGAPWLGSSTGFPNWNPTGGPAGAQVRSNVYYGSAVIYSYDLGSNWILEENRIRGGYNNEAWGLPPRAYLREDSNEVRYRNNALIYSGIFNSRTKINETNVFNSAEDITKAIDPHNGSVQLIDVLDNNLTIYQENKVSQALVDKDAIYSAEGSPLNTTSNVVIGQVTPYVGDYGISTNPESFAKFGFRRYFVDRFRNSVMRLSRDGLTPISNYGMNDYFRDELSRISDLNTSYLSDEYSISDQDPPFPYVAGPQEEVGPYVELAIAGDENGFEIETGSQVQYFANGEWYDSDITVTGTQENSAGTAIDYVYLTGASFGVTVGGTDYEATKVRFLINKANSIQGGYDTYKDNYIISLQERSGSKTDDLTSDYYSTIAFDDNIKGWTTFYTYRPSFIFSLKNNLYTTFENDLYRHYTNDSYNNFYGVYSDSSVEFVLNDNPSIMKNFKTVNYEGSDGWQLDSMVTDNEGPAYGGYSDVANVIKSYQEGLYTTGGIEYRAGFNLKENKFLADIINNSQVQQNEVNFGNQITGVKGFFAVLKLSTDSTTRPQGEKQLFSVGSEIVLSSK